MIKFMLYTYKEVFCGILGNKLEQSQNGGRETTLNIASGISRRLYGD